VTPRALYLALYGAGVTYWETSAGKLGYRVRKGLSADLRAAMKTHKDDLLFLCAGGVTVYGKGQEPAEWKEVA